MEFRFQNVMYAMIRTCDGHGVAGGQLPLRRQFRAIRAHGALRSSPALEIAEGGRRARQATPPPRSTRRPVENDEDTSRPDRATGHPSGDLLGLSPAKPPIDAKSTALRRVGSRGGLGPDPGTPRPAAATARETLRTARRGHEAQASAASRVRHHRAERTRYRSLKAPRCRVSRGAWYQ